MAPLADLAPDHDLDHLEAALAHVTDWDCAVDVGAHVGIWTRRMLERFDEVWAFEPHKPNFEQLPDLSVNFNVALGSRPGHCKLAPGDRNTGQWHIDGEGEIPIATLDEFVLSPGLLKIDVEGYELYVLEGAKETLERSRPVVILEDNGLSARYGVAPGECGEFLISLGYRVAAVRWKDWIFTCES